MSNYQCICCWHCCMHVWEFLQKHAWRFLSWRKMSTYLGFARRSAFNLWSRSRRAIASVCLKTNLYTHEGQSQFGGTRPPLLGVKKRETSLSWEETNRHGYFVLLCRSSVGRYILMLTLFQIEKVFVGSLHERFVSEPQSLVELSAFEPLSEQDAPFQEVLSKPVRFSYENGKVCNSAHYFCKGHC